MRTKRAIAGSGCQIYLAVALVWVALFLAGCASGHQQPSTLLDVQSDPGALKGASPVALAANDKLLLEEAKRRFVAGGGPALAASAAPAPHVLTLHAVYAREQALTANLPYHGCMGPGFQDAQADVKAMDAQQPNFEVSLVLTRDGEPLWQVRSQTRVRSSKEAVAFANRLVERFLADWRAANPQL